MPCPKNWIIQVFFLDINMSFYGFVAKESISEDFVEF